MVPARTLAHPDRPLAREPAQQRLVRPVDEGRARLVDDRPDRAARNVDPDEPSHPMASLLVHEGETIAGRVPRKAVDRPRRREERIVDGEAGAGDRVEDRHPDAIDRIARLRIGQRFEPRLDRSFRRDLDDRDRPRLDRIDRDRREMASVGRPEDVRVVATPRPAVVGQPPFATARRLDHHEIPAVEPHPPRTVGRIARRRRLVLATARGRSKHRLGKGSMGRTRRLARPVGRGQDVLERRRVDPPRVDRLVSHEPRKLAGQPRGPRVVGRRAAGHAGDGGKRKQKRRDRERKEPHGRRVTRPGRKHKPQRRTSTTGATRSAASSSSKKPSGRNPKSPATMFDGNDAQSTFSSRTFAL